ncbi:MAG: hypothetical protein ACRD96_18450, partial [Bryobacteraceae bacterium]
AIFAFCTLAWSTASRALWQHGPAMLLIAASLLLLILASRRPSWIPLVGALLALAVQVRPPVVIVAVAVTVYVWRHHRAKFVFYLLWASTVCFVFALFNHWIYRSPLAPYITGETSKFAVHFGFFEALTGSLISPARGLLVFSPVFALSLYRFFVVPTGETTRRLRPYLVSILVCYWIMIALYPIWWGGHSIGARYFSDLTPILVFCLIPVFERGRLAVLVLVALAIPSLLINSRCAIRLACHEWNVKPVDVNSHPERVWDWSDPPFLR